MTKTHLPAIWRSLLPKAARALTGLILGGVVVAVSLGAPARGEALDTILARMDSSAKSANSFSANMRWSEFTRILNDTEVHTGTMKLKRVGKAVHGRMDVDPNSFTWHFAGDTWEKYIPKSNILTVYKVSKLSKSADQYLLLVFGTSGADLKKTYDLKMIGEESAAGVQATHLELIPKEKKAREYAAKVELWIPVGQAYGVQVKVTEPNGDYNLWTYTDAKVNPGLPDSAFEFTPPANVTRQVMN